MKIAKKAAWANAAGDKLVEDGSEEAAMLVASRGTPVKEEKLEAFSNADDFFVDEADYKPAKPPAPAVATVMTTTNITKKGEAVEDGSLVKVTKAHEDGPKSPVVERANKSRARGSRKV